MPTFLYTARSPQGPIITGRMGAHTLSAARCKLETQGFGEIRFHTDDMDSHIAAAVTDGVATRLLAT